MDNLLTKTIPGSYRGYYLKEYYKLASEPIGWAEMSRLKRIPPKITTFVNKAVIEEIRRYNLKDDYTKNQYFLKTKDNRFFELIY